MTEQPPITYELSTPDEAPAGGRNTKALVVAAIAVVVVLALAGGAFAVIKKLDGGGPQPHDVLPASVIAYARVDVDPSASQKIALFKLIRKFPEAADQIGIKSADQDVRKLLVEGALDEADCDLTYDKDVKPWLGSRIGVALDTKQTPLVAIQISDEKKAKAGIKALFACGDEKASVAYLDGYAIVAETQKQADAAVKAAEAKPLADNKAFAKDFDDLGEQGIASAWVNPSKLIDAFPELKDMMGSTAGTDLERLEQSGTTAVTLRADGSSLELAGLSGLTDSVAKQKAAHMGKLPADTVAALSVGGLGDQVAAQYNTILEEFSKGFAPSSDDVDTSGMSPEEKAAYQTYLENAPIGLFDPEDLIKEFENSTGLKLPADLETLFGDELTFAVGSKNLEKLPELAGPEDVAGLDVALKMTTDPAKAYDLAKRLAALAGQAGIELPTKQTADGAVIATNQGAADAIDASGGKLGDDDTFKSVMPYGDDTLYGLFVDVGTVLDKLSDANPPDDVAKDIEEAKALKAVGFSYATKGKHTVFSLRVAFSK
ncbi:DUF3352 domain-containing protein [Aeromicrobium sp. 9AM]|uniref:DUF3352 domain-containing protein n=1 Tax=Aeromicrobium sp. 9AM TaxID=2653126 RepID=UPI0012F2166E|nr:DUF3352 domain-containing protein [Aeromicrobium sp. 9AM]VXC46000.1 conserved hypothetical protein [Aeromicrobium sp. 9AM]